MSSFPQINSYVRAESKICHRVVLFGRVKPLNIAQVLNPARERNMREIRRGAGKDGAAAVIRSSM